MTELQQPASSKIARFEAALLRSTDIAWLAAFRMLFGVTLCVSMLRFLGNGWIDQFFVQPSFHFKYFGFEWVEPLSASGMHALFWLLAGLALCISLGLFFRVTAPLFTLGFTYIQLIDVATYLNHYYLASLLCLLLSLSPAHRAYSVDALLWPRRAREITAAAWLYLFRFQVAIVYTFAGIAKLHGDWLLDAQPLRIWLGSRTDLPLLGPLFTWEHAPLAMSWAGFLFDTTIAGWLLFGKTRPFAYAVVIVFHTVTSALFPIGMFPVIMVLSALVFFPADWPRRLLARAQTAWRRVRGVTASGEPNAAATTAPPTLAPEPSRAWRLARRAALGVGVAYCALQLLMPLRFLAYGGNVRWHEQGMRFSWRVMVREKNGSITFFVRQQRTGRVWHVSPRSYLTPIQEREMAGQPDLILQLAHHVREDFERKGLGPVEVRAEALVSLNGRRLAPLIDPNVDLTAVQDGLGKASWILPAPSQRPPHIRPI